MLKVNHLSGFGKKRPVIGGGGYDSDAQPYISALAALGINDTTLNNAWNTHVLALKTAGVWPKCVAIYPFGGGTASAHAINGKNPGTYNTTWNGTVTHDANGVTGNGSSGYGDTGLHASSVLSDSNTHLSIYSRTTGGGADSMTEIGCNNAFGTQAISLRVRFAGNFTGCMYALPGAGAEDEESVANSDGKGFYVVTRRSSTDMEMYKDGSTAATETGTKVRTIPALNIYICAINHNNLFANELSNRNLAYASIGASLTDTEVVDFTTAVEAFQDALSRGVV
jgi:hypothetical protein